MKPHTGVLQRLKRLKSFILDLLQLLLDKLALELLTIGHGLALLLWLSPGSSSRALEQVPQPCELLAINVGGSQLLAVLVAPKELLGT